MSSLRYVSTALRKTPLAGIILAIFAWTTHSSAEEISHAVNFPKGDAAWTVRLEKVKKPSANNPPAPPSREIEKIEIVRIGNIRRDVVHWSLGGTTEYWWMAKPPIVLFQAKPGEPVRSMTPNLLSTTRYDQSLFSWIGPSTFVQVETANGKKVQRYQQEISIEDGTMRQSALIDAKTGLPVEWSNERDIAHFSFDAKLPETRPEMPPEFQAALKELEGYYTPPKRVSRW